MVDPCGRTLPSAKVVTDGTDLFFWAKFEQQSKTRSSVVGR
jgi:hypothetical protein